MVSIQDLKRFDIFKGLEDAELEEIAKLCREHVCEPDSICFTEGGKAEDVHLLREGKVEIEIELRRPWRHTKATVIAIGPGRVFEWFTPNADQR